MRGVGFLLLLLLALLGGVATSKSTKSLPKSLARRLEDRRDGESGIVIQVFSRDEEEKGGKVTADDPCDCNPTPPPCVCEESTTTPEPCVCEEETTTPTPCICEEDTTTTPMAEFSTTGGSCDENQFKNADFEQPRMESGNHHVVIPASDLPFWQPTGVEATVEIIASGYNGIPCPSGSQCVVLLQFSVGQAVSFNEAGVYTWSFWHCGWSAGSLLIVTLGNDETHEPIETQYFTTDTSGWKYYEQQVTLTDPTVVRFEFGAASLGMDGGVIDNVRVHKCNTQTPTTPSVEPSMPSVETPTPSVEPASTTVVEVTYYSNDISWVL